MFPLNRMITRPECPECGEEMVPMYTIEEEEIRGIKTDRKRFIVDYFLCEYCGAKELTDGIPLQEWHY